jgi:hypothetical protein
MVPSFEVMWTPKLILWSWAKSMVEYNPLVKGCGRII